MLHFSKLLELQQQQVSKVFQITQFVGQVRTSGGGIHKGQVLTMSDECSGKHTHTICLNSIEKKT